MKPTVAEILVFRKRLLKRASIHYELPEFPNIRTILSQFLTLLFQGRGAVKLTVAAGPEPLSAFPVFELGS